MGPITVWSHILLGASAQLVLNLNHRDNLGSSIAPHNSHGKRSAVLPLTNAREYYWTNIEIGSPPQDVSVIIDTGSADLWVPQLGALGGDENSEFCLEQSGTWQYNNSEFELFYRDNTVARGFWGTDTLGIGTSQVGNASLAVGTFTNASMGILGLGMQAFESTITGTVDGELQGAYANLPMLLKQQGIINSLSYSLSLGKVNETGGALVFGGIDHASYTGTLYKVPLVRTYESDNPITTSVMLHSISTHGKELLQCAIPILVDSGSSINYMPAPFVEAIAGAFNATWNQDTSAYIIDCYTNTSLDLNLSGIQVNIPFTQNVPLKNQTNQQLYVDGVPVCMLPFRPSASSFILGVTTLRSLYLSFDYENGEVAIAQYSPRSDHSIEAIGTDGIPGAQQAPSYSSTQSSTAYSLAVSVSHIRGAQSAISLTSLAEPQSTATATVLTDSSTDSSNSGCIQAAPRWSNFVAAIICGFI